MDCFIKIAITNVVVNLRFCFVVRYILTKRPDNHVTNRRWELGSLGGGNQIQPVGRHQSALSLPGSLTRDFVRRHGFRQKRSPGAPRHLRGAHTGPDRSTRPEHASEFRSKAQWRSPLRRQGRPPLLTPALAAEASLLQPGRHSL